MSNLADYTEGIKLDKPPLASRQLPFASSLHKRLHFIQWLTPLVMILLVVIYEVSSGIWIEKEWGQGVHLIVEILVFGLLGPTLALVLIHFFRRWLEEKETSELQTQLLAQVQERFKNSQVATDEAIQAIFAASVLLASFEGRQCSEEDRVVISQTQKALEKTVKNLRSQLKA